MSGTIHDIWFGILDKNPAAWSELVRRFGSLVHTVAKRSGLSDTEADDCAQQTWIALYRSRCRIRDPHKLPAWLIRVTARNAAQIAQNRDSGIQVSEHVELTGAGLLPDEELESLETAALVHLAINSLDSRCRKLLHALYLSPKSRKYRQICEDLGIPANSIGPTRSRCLKKLRRILEEYDCL